MKKMKTNHQKNHLNLILTWLRIRVFFRGQKNKLYSFSNHHRIMILSFNASNNLLKMTSTYHERKSRLKMVQYYNQVKNSLALSKAGLYVLSNLKNLLTTLASKQSIDPRSLKYYLKKHTKKKK